MFNLGEVIDKEFVLTRIHQEFIFEKYLEIKIEFGKKYLNPLRIDNNPDCYFNYDKRGILKFVDFARGWSWDCFNVVQIKYNCSFKDSLLIISNDFNLTNKPVDIKLVESFRNKSFYKKEECIIDIKIRNWRKYDIEYWNQFGIDLTTLQFFKVIPIEYAWINKELIYTFRNNDLAYYYNFNNKDGQLYLPFRNKNKNKFYITSSNIVMGYDQLPLSGDYLIITKSYKDIMSMNSFEIPAISPSSENVLIKKQVIDDFKKRFKNIYTLYDNDIAGKKASLKMKKSFHTTPLLFPKDHYKDFSDNVKNLKIEYMIDYVEDIKQKLL
jgi:5S rRNA maturation endonuclease (ribonuclease M5)